MTIILPPNTRLNCKPERIQRKLDESGADVIICKGILKCKNGYRWTTSEDTAFVYREYPKENIEKRLNVVRCNLYIFEEIEAVHE